MVIFKNWLIFVHVTWVQNQSLEQEKKTLEIGAFWKCMADFVTIFFRQITYRSRFSLNAERSDAKIGGKGDGDIAAFWQGRKIACVNTIFHYEP